jgi:uncharacterized phage protein gp47/JayE
MASTISTLLATSTPTPRSYQQILADIADTFLSNYGLPALKVGSPLLRLMEAAAMSDFRSSQDIFNMLRSVNIDQATGQALDLLGADENLPRLQQTYGSGPVTITDTSFSKIATQIYSGQPAPIQGSTVIYVTNASAFPASGSVYLGRGTTDYEGPLAYASITNLGTYYAINLSGSTSSFHNYNETVILAQGGNRVVPAGTLVQTPQGNSTSAVQFSTLYAATLPDGETNIQNVTVVAQTPGTVSNVPANNITAFTSPPFTNATVTNPTPITNAQDQETDDAYRQRIKNQAQSMTQGTALALITGSVGVTSQIENKTVISANVVTRSGYPTILYIDDGTGYEEVDQGVAYEQLVASAVGGEQYFQIQSVPPVAKAFLLSTTTSPWNITPGSAIAIQIAGVTYQHTFNASDFASPTAATPYEISASINADANVIFNCRVVNNATQVAIYAVQDTNESLQVVSPTPGTVDANLALGFPYGVVNTMNLYRNGILQSKDGRTATLQSFSPSQWGTLSAPQTFTLAVDGTPAQTYTLQNSNFQAFGYPTLSSGNPLSVWAQVLNAAIPGITVTVNGGVLNFSTNLALNGRGSLVVSGSGLGNTFFGGAVSSYGANNNFSLDRNRGQIVLVTPLNTGDSLTIGSKDPRAFLASSTFSSVTFPNKADWYFLVDSSVTLRATGVSNALTMTLATDTGNNITNSVKVTATTSAPPFLNNIQAGDWAVFYDNAFNAANQGIFQVDYVDPLGFFFNIKNSALSPQPITGLVTSGLAFASGGVGGLATGYHPIQRVRVAPGVYTANSLAVAMNSRTNTFRLASGSGTVGITIAGTPVTVTWATSDAVTMTNLATTINGNVTANYYVTAAAYAGTAADDASGTPGYLILTSTGNNVPHITTVPTGTGMTSEYVKLVDGFQGATALAFQTNSIHVRTNSQALNDDIALVAQNSTAAAVGLPVSVTTNATNHAAASESGHSSLGTPNFLNGFVTAGSSQTAFTAATTYGITTGNNIVGLRGAQDNYNAAGNIFPSFGNNNQFVSSVSSVSGTSVVTTRPVQTKGWLANDAFYVAAPFAITPTDTIGFVVDGNTTTQRFVFNTYRKVNPTTSTYGQTNSFYDVNNNNAILTAGFGLSFDFVDYAVYMHARTKSHAEGGDTQKTVVWRATDFGSGGNNYTVAYGYPTAPGQGISVTAVNTTGANTNVYVNLASGAAITGSTLTGSAHVGIAVSSTTGGNYYNAFFLGFNLPITTGLSQSGTTTVTVTPQLPSSPFAVTGHGFVTGMVVYINSTDAHFPSGYYPITGYTATTFTYTNSASGTWTNTVACTVSYDVAADVLSGSVTTSTIALVGPGSGVPAGNQVPMNITTLNTLGWTGILPASSQGTLTTAVQWFPINNTSYLQFYPLSLMTAAQIATAVTALAGTTNSTCPITGSPALAGSSNITLASYEEFTTSGYNYQFSDGINYIQNQVSPLSTATNYTLTFKNTVNASLATNSGWATEDVRLVPFSAKNIAAFFGSPTVTGLSSVAEVSTSSANTKVQVTSLTLGSASSVQCQGGPANSSSGSVVGAASQVASTYGVFTVAASDATPLVGGMWVALQNTIAQSKTTITSSSVLTNVGTVANTFTFSGAPVWAYSGSGGGTISNCALQFEKQGNFVAVIWTGFGSNPVVTGVAEGDWVSITSGSAATVASGPTGSGTYLPATSTVNTSISQTNGCFRVVRINAATNTFWIENASAIEEISVANITFLTFNSIMPGDTFSVSLPVSAWGLAAYLVFNQIYTVKTSWNSLSPSVYSFVVNTPSTSWGSNTFSGTINLGSTTPPLYPLVYVTSAGPTRLIKQILSKVPNQGNGAFTDIKVTTYNQYTDISSAYGTLVQGLDKLQFPTTLNTGTDGYSEVVGLIGAVNTTIYGSPQNPTALPGIVAAGATVDVSSPLVLRVKVSLALRVLSGIVVSDIEQNVQSVVAAVINNTPVGQSIPISQIVAAASSVNGVLAVTVLSPAYSSGNDLIPVQPFEKPLVININTDVLVSLVGG